MKGEALLIDHESTTDDKFSRDVLNGLNSTPKFLESKYFYDKNGDALFQQIMAMPEYYLTDCELDIFKHQTPWLAGAIQQNGTAFDLLELGPGNAQKSSYLLRYLVEERTDFTYMPIDISGNILNVLQHNLKEELPDLAIVALEGDYLDMLDQATSRSSRRKVVLFLGGNIGNMEPDEAAGFCAALRQKLAPGDLVLMGFDLKKNPATILNAYHDEAGVTAAFNLNLLLRMNNELGADFDIRQFQHYPTYDPLTGACKSYLISQQKQVVRMGGKSILFMENEPIYMEISQKFDPEGIDQLALQSGFRPLLKFEDSKQWFVDVIWEVDG